MLCGIQLSVMANVWGFSLFLIRHSNGIGGCFFLSNSYSLLFCVLIFYSYARSLSLIVRPKCFGYVRRAQLLAHLHMVVLYGAAAWRENNYAIFQHLLGCIALSFALVMVWPFLAAVL